MMMFEYHLPSCGEGVDIASLTNYAINKIKKVQGARFKLQSIVTLNHFHKLSELIPSHIHKAF